MCPKKKGEGSKGPHCIPQKKQQLLRWVPIALVISKACYAQGAGPRRASQPSDLFVPHGEALPERRRNSIAFRRRTIGPKTATHSCKWGRGPRGVKSLIFMGLFWCQVRHNRPHP